MNPFGRLFDVFRREKEPIDIIKDEHAENKRDYEDMLNKELSKYSRRIQSLKDRGIDTTCTFCGREGGVLKFSGGRVHKTCFKENTIKVKR